MKTSWSELIRTLKYDAGMTYAEIGREVGLSTGAIGDLATGRTICPSWAPANKLLALHFKRCGTTGEPGCPT
ncbi:MAG: helix-turn-helix domain-containing protein [Bradyrhizobium sp.]|nr:helix-turn-helix domain-containing protein [Bradyrhizobium sp.]